MSRLLGKCVNGLSLLLFFFSLLGSTLWLCARRSLLLASSAVSGSSSPTHPLGLRRSVVALLPPCLGNFACEGPRFFFSASFLQSVHRSSVRPKNKNSKVALLGLMKCRHSKLPPGIVANLRVRSTRQAWSLLNRSQNPTRRSIFLSAALKRTRTGLPHRKAHAIATNCTVCEIYRGLKQFQRSASLKRGAQGGQALKAGRQAPGRQAGTRGTHTTHTTHHTQARRQAPEAGGRPRRPATDDRRTHHIHKATARGRQPTVARGQRAPKTGAHTTHTPHTHTTHTHTPHTPNTTHRRAGRHPRRAPAQGRRPPEAGGHPNYTTSIVAHWPTPGDTRGCARVRNF